MHLLDPDVEEEDEGEDEDEDEDGPKILPYLKTKFDKTMEISLVLGTKLPADWETTLANIKNAGTTYKFMTRRVNSMFKTLRKDFDLIIVDFNPKESAVNDTLLSQCDRIVSLVSPDSYSINAMNQMAARAKSLKLNGSVYIVPTKIKKSNAKSKIPIMRKYQTFINKVQLFVKKQRNQNNTKIKYAGHLIDTDLLMENRVMDLLRTPPVLETKPQTEFFDSYQKLFKKVMANDSDDLKGVESAFLWNIYEESFIVKNRLRVICVLRSITEDERFKVVYKEISVRKPEKQSSRKKTLGDHVQYENFQFYQAYGHVVPKDAYATFVQDVFEKTRTYFADFIEKKDEKCEFETTSRPHFEVFIEDLESKEFVQDLLLEF